jgi:hypothetical protein
MLYGCDVQRLAVEYFENIHCALCVAERFDR